MKFPAFQIKGRDQAINKPSPLPAQYTSRRFRLFTLSDRTRTETSFSGGSRARVIFPFCRAKKSPRTRLIARAAADTSAGDFFDQMDVLVLNKDQSACAGLN